MVPRDPPDRCCDMIMKGGITSGVVYPLAVTRLAEEFRLKSVGGTSAGAIAAAAAAAAEHGRRHGGFDELATLPEWLGAKAPGSRDSNLFRLFEPQRRTRALFHIATAPLRVEGPAWVKLLALLGAAISEHGWWALLGAVPGALVLLDALRRSLGAGPVLEALAGLVLAAIGVLTAVAIALVAGAGRALVGNLYGLCTGRSRRAEVDEAAAGPAEATPEEHETALSDWLTGYLNRLAGKPPQGPPLTFGELWWPDLPAAERGPADQQAIRLEMMTTCLSHGRPYRLPFRDDEDVHENGLFSFKPEEFRRIFPKRVVDWMTAHPRAESSGAQAAEHAAELARAGLVPLPDPWNLPVVVATRMSLSFPVLLSMVPLYATDFTRKDVAPGAKPQPEHCWFSDGGMCSNFPIHFFDAPLPRWPTFAIDLCQTPPGGKPGVRMVESNNEDLRDTWSRFGEGTGVKNLLQFGGMAMKTMQNWNDAMSSRLPGQRDRIAHVALGEKDGGLNLNMPADRIAKLAGWGRDAGTEFVSRFAPGQPPVLMNWANHRWIRLRTTLAALDEMVTRIRAACVAPQPGDPGYDQLVGSPAKPPSYAWHSQRQQYLAGRVLRVLKAIAGRLDTESVDLAENSPRPRPELRPRPRT